MTPAPFSCRIAVMTDNIAAQHKIRSASASGKDKKRERRKDRQVCGAPRRGGQESEDSAGTTSAC